MTTIIRGAKVGSGINVNSQNYLSVTADLSAETWNTVASHEIFTVTGLVCVYIWIECTESLTGDTATIQLGVDGSTNEFIDVTTCTDIDAGVIWYDSENFFTYQTRPNAIITWIVNGLDIGYEIATAAATDGTLVFHCVWEPMNPTGSVVAGAGGALA